MSSCVCTPPIFQAKNPVPRSLLVDANQLIQPLEGLAEGMFGVSFRNPH